MTTKTDKFTLILYGPFGPYRCFEIGKKSVKALLLAIPVVVLFSVLILALMYSYFTHFRTLQIEPITANKTSTVTNESANAALTNKITSLEKENVLLSTKLAKSNQATSALSLFQTQVTTNKKAVGTKPTLQHFKLVKDPVQPHSIQFKFEMVNNSTNDWEKANGTLFVLLNTGHSLQFYPKQDLTNSTVNKNSLFSYGKGESFLFSKVRFVKANFTLSEIELKNTQFDFIILLFSKAGDVLVEQRITQHL